MVGMNRVLIALALALLASSALLPVSDGAKKPVSAPRKEDVPYIKCQVCEKLALRVYQLVKEKQERISPKKVDRLLRISDLCVCFWLLIFFLCGKQQMVDVEYEIIEIAENVCNLKKEEADWMLMIDIVEKGDKLVLVEQLEKGMCNSECKTIEAACQKVIGYSDTDVAEYIYKSKPDLKSLVNHLCKDMTDACSKNPPPVPKDRVPREPFVTKPSKDAEMDKILRSMQVIFNDFSKLFCNTMKLNMNKDLNLTLVYRYFVLPGAPGMKVFSREDIEKGNIGNDDEDGDNDEDEDEDEKFPKNLGKALRKEESKTEELKKTITKEFKKKGELLKRHAQKVSNRVRRWWKGFKSSFFKEI